jgi:hypothetical protein
MPNLHLNRTLEEEVYMTVAEGFNTAKSIRKVC